MNERLLTIIISLLTAGATSCIAYYFTLKIHLRDKEEEIKREQTYKYFLPLKFAADELFYRLLHIESEVVSKTFINFQLPQDIKNKNLDWYFVDWKNPKNPQEGAGGYFLVTTVYMHCMLYNRINTMLKEYPFLEVQVKSRLTQLISKTKDQQIDRCYNSTIEDEQTRKWVNIKNKSDLSGRIKLEELIKSIRLSSIMHGGIPYGLQTAFGQFLDIYKNNRIEQVNYEEFARLLMSDEHRVKFQPIISFYTEIIDKDFNIENTKLVKLRALIISLLLIRNAEL
jgi:hypothetical protein